MVDNAGLKPAASTGSGVGPADSTAHDGGPTLVSRLTAAYPGLPISSVLHAARDCEQAVILFGKGQRELAERLTHYALQEIEATLKHDGAPTPEAVNQ